MSKIIHLEYHPNGTHHYFGSIAAIYTEFTLKQIGVTENRLNHFKVTAENPYTNKKCTIRNGLLLRKHGNRKGPNAR